MKFSGDETYFLLGSDEQLGVVGILPLLFVNLLSVLDLFYVSLLEITHFQSPRKTQCQTVRICFKRLHSKAFLFWALETFEGSVKTN